MARRKDCREHTPKLTGAPVENAPPSTVALPLAGSSARVETIRPKADFRLEETTEMPGLGSIPQAPETTHKNASLGSIPRKAEKLENGMSKAGKLPVAKTRGNQESWTVAADAQTSFRIRLTESGFGVVLRWREPDGKRPERYCCYLSKSEWAKAKKGSLADFAQLVAGKIEQRKASGEADNSKLDGLLIRVRAFE